MKKILTVISLFALVVTSCEKEPTPPIVQPEPIIGLPTLSTSAVTNINTTTAFSGGEITNDGGAAVTERGVCWDTIPNPTVDDSKTIDGNGIGAFESSLTNLIPNKIYYIRAYAINSEGTQYGQEVNFTTSQIQNSLLNPTISYGTTSDIDGNIYPTVIVGGQEWFAINLKTTKYANGDPIAKIENNSLWVNLTDNGAWCYYGNDEAYDSLHGKLYNWYVVNDARGVCPNLWHVSTNSDWSTIRNLFGTDAPDKLSSTLVGGSNDSGFSALKSGWRSGGDGAFNSINSYSTWWSPLESNPNSAFYETLSIGYLDSKKNGFSIRCVKN